MKNIEKYNQKLIAIIGTVVVGGGALMLFGGLIGGLFSLFSFGTYQPTGLHTNGAILLKDKEKKVITYFQPEQLDTAQAKFIVPIGFVNVDTEEESSFNISKSRYSKGASGVYTNFIFIDYNTGFKRQLFHDKVMIEKWSFIKKDSIELLLFKGVNKDSNEDKELNTEDNNILFVYYIQDKELKTYEFKDKTLLNYQLLSNTNWISLTLGVDLNKDKNFNSYEEPKTLKTLKIDSKEIEDLVSSKMHDAIETLIE